ncbi:MAG: SufD family Fe-S cluster assembly protein [Thermoflavifilum sp.]|nr:SufD family Fe-S cluster assembly protein [Thermoflavifilum sp.]MCL6514874.1 SufD family Fe-S cluster assembly protein [Alicyclobacillus sp.]
MTEPITNVNANLVEELTARHGEPDWLKARRQQAWRSFETMPVPRLEKTDLRGRAWDFGPFPAATGAAVPQPLAQLEAALGDQAAVFIQDGTVTRVQVPEALRARGVVVMDLHSAAKTEPERVQQLLGRAVADDENRWSALNAALWHGGVYVRIPRGVQLEDPIHIIHSESEQARGGMPRVLIVAEPLSRAEVVEVYGETGQAAGSYVHSAVTEVIAEDGAQLRIGVVTQYRKGPTHFFTRRAVLAKDASVDWVFGDIGDGFSVGLVESRLDGDGSRSVAQGFGFGYGRQHLDLTASMQHRGRFSESDIRLFGVLRQRANSVFRSSTHMHRGAVAAGSEQHDRVLMLDATARADAIPMLLIDENDVSRCAHAASVGKIDPTQVYYLMSRGIPEKTAVQMIIWGYLQPIVDALPSQAVRDWVTQVLERKLAE